MINYTSFFLDNGLQVIVHEDPNVQNVVMNIAYFVGSRDENENKTGFAHLFEHLMFGGSANIGSYDEPLQKVGGENNAFTTPDYTNYYLSVPSVNIETAFWLESDRMLGLSFDPKVLEVQRKVVIEEFKQRYLNKPYGDAWLHLRPLAYKVHPYRWNVIGKEISHIEEATMEDVKNFFYTYYRPNNAVLVVAGNTTTEEVKRLSEKWFGPIPSGPEIMRNIPKEPEQTERRVKSVSAEVPQNVLYKVFKMPGRFEEGFFAADLLSDLLGRGKSSGLYQGLVREKQLLSSVSAGTLGTLDTGLMIITGQMNEKVSFETVEHEINQILESVKNGDFSEEELAKVKTQAETVLSFSRVDMYEKAYLLAFYALGRGDVDRVNRDLEEINKVGKNDIIAIANKVLNDKNASVLNYHAKKEGLSE
ncbi:MAG: insulinase family protein [Cyclobacteriaceae bacterium]|nr:insulinase family protein [Cyclobacteriaceae bacterium]